MRPVNKPHSNILDPQGPVPRKSSIVYTSTEVHNLAPYLVISFLHLQIVVRYNIKQKRLIIHVKKKRNIEKTGLANEREDGGMGGRSRWGNCSL